MKLTIRKPCHENWDQMTTNKKGRFCAVCSRTVRDFTNFSDEEIINVFSNSSEKNICGNFNETQLNRNLQYSYINSLFAKFAVGFVLTSGGIISVKAQQCETKKDTIDLIRELRGKVVSLEPIESKKDTASKHKVTVGGAIATTFIETKKPLYVVDGKITSEKKFKNINPDLIGKMEVLKGAAAVSIYGLKAQNGVILITSKRKLRHKNTENSSNNKSE